MLALVILFAAVLAWKLLPSAAPPPTLHAAASEVLLNVSDIPEPKWGEWASGMNGTGAWRFFSVHTELILATLNVSLWVESDAHAAQRAMDGYVARNALNFSDGGVPAADASLYWTSNFGQYGGEIVRRYNVVFLLDAHLETSFSLTRSDLAKWSGWQLGKIESFTR